MKITGYRIQSYVMKMDIPIGDANSPMGEDLMPASILWIETDLGINGIAPCAGDVGSLFDIIEGQDPREVVGLWRRMVDATHKGGLGLVSEAVSAIDIALWDILGKESGLPIHRLMGGSARNIIPLYWSVGSALYWPRERFHVSASFPKDTVRKAMVILTNEK